jgi:PAS domain S-box-containing protein
VQYIGILTIPVAGLFFAIEYTGRGHWLKPRIIALLCVLPVVTLILVWTNDVHELVWRDIHLEATDGFLVKVSSYGAWFWFYLAYAYSLMLVGTSLVIGLLIGSRDIYRRQAAALLVFALVPCSGNLLYIFRLNPLEHLDLTPFAFIISGAALAWGLFRFRLADLLPVAYSRIIESLDDSIIVLDARDRILELNPAAKRLTDQSDARIIGRPLGEALPELRDQLDTSRYETVVGREIVLSEAASQRVYDARLHSSIDQKGHPTCKVLVLRDMTEQKRARDRIQEQNEFLETVLESLTHPFCVIDADDYALLLANSMARLEGSATALTCHALTHGRDEPCTTDGHPCPLEEVKRTKSPVMVEHVHGDEEGNSRYCEVHAYPILDAEGNVAQMIEYSLDVTRRKQTEELLRLLSSAVKQSTEGLAVMDLEGTLIFVNRAFASAHGYEPNDLIGKNLSVFHTPDQIPSVESAKRELIETGEFNGELWHVHRDGTPFPTLMQNSVLRNENGEPTALISTMRDITDRKRMEEELREHRDNLEEQVRKRTSELTEAINQLRQEIASHEKTSKDLRVSEEKYKNMFWEAPDIFYTLDLETMIITDANKYALESLGYGPEFLGKIHISEIIHPDDFERSAKRLSDMVINKDRHPNFPLQVLTKAGEVRHIEQSGVIFWDDDGNAKTFLGLARDVTERKLAEEKVFLSEERYHRILDSCHDIIVVVDESANFLFVNDGYVKQTGYTIEEANETPALSGIHDDDRANVATWLQRAITGEKIQNVEFRYASKDGQYRWVQTNANRISWPEARNAIVVIARDINEQKKTAIELERSHERYGSILDACHDMISVVDEQTNLLFANKAVHEQTGYTLEDIERIDGFDTIHEDDRERIAQWFLKVLNGEPARDIEYRGIHKSGETRWVECNADLIYWDQGQKAVVNVLRDITERKTMEEELKLTKERYHSVLDASHDMILVVDSGMNNLLFANQAAKKEALYTVKEWGRVNIFYTIHEDDREKLRNGFQRTLAGESVRDVEYRAVKKDGTIKWISGNSDLIEWPGWGKAVIASGREITKRKRAEETLKISEERYHQILDSSHDMISVLNEKGELIFANNAYIEGTGYTIDETNELGLVNMVHPDDQEKIRNSIQKVFAGGHERSFECRRINKNGEIRWAESNVDPIHWSGVENAVVAVTRDITERHHMEEALRLSEERYRQILDASRNNIVVMDDNAYLLYANRSWREDTGYTIDDFKNDSFANITHPDDIERVSKWFLRVLDGESLRNVEYRRIIKNGETRWVESNASLCNWPGATKAVVNVSMDITDRKQAEEALRIAEQRYRSILDSSTENIFVFDIRGRALYANRSWQEDTGYTLEEAQSDPSFNIIHPYDLEKVANWIRDMATGESLQNIDYRRINKSGAIRWVESNAAPINWPGTDRAFVNILRDITERKQVEEELANSRRQLRDLSMHLQSLREQERTHIAREIHDDLGQALTVLKMDTSWLVKRLPKNRKVLLEKAEAMFQLIDATIQSVKRISAELRPGLLDDLGLAAAIEWQAEEFQERTEIECTVRVTPKEISADKEHSTAIFRIFQEAITNIARHAQATEVTVRLEERDDQLVLTVRDNGKGIAESDQSKADAFGLMGMRERAHGLGGTAEIIGVRGEGTSVIVTIPIHK